MYTGIDRRQVDKLGIRRLTDKVIDIRKEVKFINGRVRELEDNEILQEGIRKGKFIMKTSTRNLIILACIVFGCMFAGIKTFQSSQASLMAAIEAKINQSK